MSNNTIQGTSNLSGTRLVKAQAPKNPSFGEALGHLAERAQALGSKALHELGEFMKKPYAESRNEIYRNLK
ncbi:MAG: hypothetical protein HYV07_08485 [Deltaproteobacteria bacterium]|nr:hypothetical protein [Deltaproteobacteria bacterium]